MKSHSLLLFISFWDSEQLRGRRKAIPVLTTKGLGTPSNFEFSVWKFRDFRSRDSGSVLPGGGAPFYVSLRF